MEFYSHQSTANNATMRFAIFLPPQAQKQQVPVLYYLSGLTCTEENFMIKAGAQQHVAELGIALVSMDTSPRNTGIAGEDDEYYFGSGAGFYLNATVKKWAKHYNMYDYVLKELPELIGKHFNINPNKKSIFGHSMGGHGAITIALKNPQEYHSVSAFAPIVAPTQNHWGQNAFEGYLGNDQTSWKQYDSCELIKTAKHKIPLFIDQGTEDEYLNDYLKPDLLQQVCKQYKHPLNLRMQTGYDHSYYFINSFMQDHLQYHAKQLL